MQCHFQLFQDNAWHDCATLTLLEAAGGNPRTGTLLEYDLDYAFGAEVAPLSLRYPVTAEMQKLAHWPAFIFDLIPQGSGRTYLDDDIVAFLRPHIATQIGQLKALGEY